MRTSRRLLKVALGRSTMIATPASASAPPINSCGPTASLVNHAPNATVISGEISVNGISVIRQLLDAGLLDTLTLTVHPVLVGQGRRLFDELAEPFRLDLVDSQITSVGNAMLTYAKHA